MERMIKADCKKRFIATVPFFASSSKNGEAIRRSLSKTNKRSLFLRAGVNILKPDKDRTGTGCHRRACERDHNGRLCVDTGTRGDRWNGGDRLKTNVFAWGVVKGHAGISRLKGPIH